MMEEIEKIILTEHPNFLMAYDDINSTLARALAVSKLNIKVLHIESGLSSFNVKCKKRSIEFSQISLTSITFNQYIK